MNKFPSTKVRRGNDHGATLLLVAVSMAALLSVVALAVDIGMLLNARTEAQRAADSAALAGAGSLINYLGSDTAGQATQEATEFGELHDVAGQTVDIEPDDVEVDEAQSIVRVTVHRDQVRGGPVPTWFARVFGTDLVNVAAAAAAQISPASLAKCVKPFTIPDLYQDVNGNGQYDEGVDYYGSDSTGYGSAFRNTGHTGQDGSNRTKDFGKPLIVKGGGPHGAGCCPNTGPSWYYLWAFGGRGGRTVRDNIRDHCAKTEAVSTSETYDIEPGNKVGPVEQGVEDLIALDPNATWDDSCNCVVDSKYGDDWQQSERIGIIPLFHPGRAFQPGRKPIEFTSFIAVFFEKVEKVKVGKGNEQHVYVRLLFASGVGGGEGDPGAGIKYVHLVE